MKVFNIKVGDELQEVFNYLYNLTDCYDHKARKNITLKIDFVKDKLNATESK